jgi:4'-phosphopantetheinyl transferase
VTREPFHVPEQDDRQRDRTACNKALKQPLLGELSVRDIDVWTVQLSLPDIVVDRCFVILSPDEKARAERFVFEHHRRAYVLSRGILRALLSHYVSLPSADLQFSYKSKGKPYLLEFADQIGFNCSHSDGMALYAITRCCDLGVDIEKIRPLQDMEQIAQCFFCPEELCELLSLTPAEREVAFFRCWSRKEAYIKAVGDGLSIPLNAFCVTLTPGDPAGFVQIGNDRKLASEWTLHELPAIPGYAAAIAYHDTPRPICWKPVVTVTEVLTLLEAHGRGVRICEEESGKNRGLVRREIGKE